MSQKLIPGTWNNKTIERIGGRPGDLHVDADVKIRVLSQELDMLERRSGRFDESLDHDRCGTNREHPRLAAARHAA